MTNVDYMICRGMLLRDIRRVWDFSTVEVYNAGPGT